MIVFGHSLTDALLTARTAALIGVLSILPVGGMAEDGRDWVRLAVDQLCPAQALTGLDAQDAIPGSWLLDEMYRPSAAAPALARIRLALSDAGELRLERRAVGGALRQFRIEYHAPDGAGGTRPELQAIADGSCTIGSARIVRKGDDGWVYLDQLEGDLETLRWTDTLSAPWPEGRDPGGVRVGFVDSGLAYDLPLFRDRLARDEDGVPVGYDFWDLDPLPYDGDTSRGAFFPIRHGSTVASVFVEEAPDAALVPYRYPRPDMSRLGQIVERAAADGIRILAMPLGSRRIEDWEAFVAAMEGRDILAIVSAGNDGRDIDARPVYPAALPLSNMIVVTSSDGFGRLAEGSNWGAESVDIMLPAENLEVTTFRGATGSASGSSYAVPRLAALAARILEADPTLTAEALKTAVLARAQPSPFEDAGQIAVGWIADPLADPN